MKKILVILLLVFAFGCSDDATEPSRNELVGMWMMDVTPQGILEKSLLILKFSSNNEFTKIQDGSGFGTSDYQGTYSINGDVITFVGGDCRKVEGKYKFKFRDNGVEFTLIEDECKEREYVVGFFEKYAEPIFE
jgi:hypothetical protein